MALLRSYEVKSALDEEVVVRKYSATLGMIRTANQQKLCKEVWFNI